MSFRIGSVVVAVVLAALSTSLRSSTLDAQGQQGDRVILITLDGARTQEMFGGSIPRDPEGHPQGRPIARD